MVNVSFPLNLDVLEALAFKCVIRPLFALSFHPLISCDDMVLVSERLMTFMEPENRRVGSH